MLLQFPNFKFQENPFDSSQAVTADGERERNKETNTAKLKE
jgi:hypothetical protein